MKDDLIDRQATLEALLDKGQRSRRYKVGDIWELNFDEIREAVDAIPAAEPKSYRMGYQAGYAAAKKEQKRGKWIIHYGNWADIYECDQCHHESKEGGKYCPHCGARMEDSDE